MDIVVVNVDATLVAEAPKMAPYLPGMKANLADALAVAPNRVGIKATTNEGLGFLGAARELPRWRWLRWRGNEPALF